jgi:peptidylprolyl isomerase
MVMKLLRVAMVLLVLPVVLNGCKLKEDASSGGIPAPPDVAAPPANALKTASGLASKVITVGLGSVHPTPRSEVTVHYTGWTTDGKMFDSSVQRGKPSTFSVNEVIPGWTEALQLMVVGEKRRFWIPENLAYPNPGPGDPKGMLVFDIELLDIK